MRTLGNAEILGLWERGFRRHPLDRALLALAAAFPDLSYESLADWPIGLRNQALSKLFCQCFGLDLRAWTICANCNEKLEFEMNPLLLTGRDFQEDNRLIEPMTANGRVFRIPTSRDLAQAASATDPAAGAVRIVESCLLGECPPAKWSDEELSAIGERLASADPLAEMCLTLHCPNCGKDWQETFDLVSFFWILVEARARQLLFAIHTLASTYGWSEADILSMSENRRAVYMEMLQS
jgi:hypothetical protein